MTNKLPPIHPGEILKTEFMEPLNLSANKLAQAIKVPANRISAIVNGSRSITGDTAMRLAKAFGTSSAFWMNLQSRYDLDVAEDTLGVSLEDIHKVA